MPTSKEFSGESGVIGSVVMSQLWRSVENEESLAELLGWGAFYRSVRDGIDQRTP